MDSLSPDTHILYDIQGPMWNRVLWPADRKAQCLRTPPPPYFLRAKVHCSIPTEAVIVGFEQSAQRCPVSRPLLEELGHELPFPRWVLTGNVGCQPIRGTKPFELRWQRRGWRRRGRRRRGRGPAANLLALSRELHVLCPAQLRATLMILRIPAAPSRDALVVPRIARRLVVERGAVLRRRRGGGAKCTAAPHIRIHLRSSNIEGDVRSRGRGNSADAAEHAEGGQQALEEWHIDHLRVQSARV